MRKCRLPSRLIRISNDRIVLTLATLVFLVAFQSCLPFANADESKNEPVLYFFTSDGCPPCKMIEPMLRDLSYEGFSIMKIDVNKYPAWQSKFQIEKTPTLVLVKDKDVLVRHLGVTDAGTIKGWFAQANSGVRPSAPLKEKIIAVGEPRYGVSQITENTRKNDPIAPNFATVHKGTTRASNRIEQRALGATVRLRVEDPEGISFATGTVVHCHEGEWLVLTCGHVFRDSGGSGEISAEFGFEKGQVDSAPGKLIYYTAEARDVGLVAVQAGFDIEPVTIAEESAPVVRGNPVFSIGCDHGENPTIRHSRIKNCGVYSGAVKYDIYGRPVNGRSGGGLFNRNGELVGVCNAAAVEFDEGIYTALETIYWQMKTVNLEYLFERNRSLESTPKTQLASTQLPHSTRPANVIVSPYRESQNVNDSDRPKTELIPPANAIKRPKLDSKVAAAAYDEPVRGNTPVARWEKQERSMEGEVEVIVIVRSNNDPTVGQAITVPNPSQGLLDYIDRVANNDDSKRLNMAQLRQNLSGQR